MFIDTHTHLYDEQLMAEEEAMIQRALDAGVHRMYMPNCDSSTIEGMMHLAQKYPQHCLPMMGLHPVYVKENYKGELAIVQEWLGKQKFAAVGEIGLDYYWDKTFVPQQKEAFELQIDWALQYDIPIVIHSRESTQDCIDVVRSKQNGKLKGIFHCFSGTLREAQQVIDLGFYLGIGGVVTFKKAGLAEIVQQLPLDNIVLETDAPYLAPTPYRGKRNESAYIPLIADKIAELKQVRIEEVARITTANAEKVFAM
ncbi:MAG: TatD family deoxyribonuclease [Sphingobacteriales bacterium]|nr:MAG: TatD family deoxyribonuclease [Sphingobacteriales bacterium]